MGLEDRVLTGVHFMQGNYAAVEGAIAAGCDFFAGYRLQYGKQLIRITGAQRCLAIIRLYRQFARELGQRAAQAESHRR